MTLIGQDLQHATFAAAVRSGRLHHAWLLVGPAGVGKASFAKQVAAKLVGGRNPENLIEARSHPDFRLLEREVWDKSNPPRIVPYDQRKDSDTLARSIRIAQIRALEPVLAMPPSLGTYRAVIIDAADDLEREGANALLKMLEEPPRGTIFFLVSHVPGRLLPTIRSRCRTLRFAPLSPVQVATILQAAMPGLSDAEVEASATAAHGSPGRALQLAANGLGAFEVLLAEIAGSGDPDNRLRCQLAKQVSGKAQSDRYNMLLERVPSFIADRTVGSDGEVRVEAIAAWEAARKLASIARAQSLVPESVLFELGGQLAALAGPEQVAKARG